MTPIVLFTYNRLSHTQRVIESLQSNPEAKDSLLYVFADKEKNAEDRYTVWPVKRYLRSISGFKKVHLIERQQNYGLANNTIDGLTFVSEAHGSFIMLEDDTVVSPFFLKFMNEHLEAFKDDETIAGIQGYLYPINFKYGNFFICGPDTWGFGSWARAWKLFEPDGSKLLREILERNLENRFNMDGSYPFLQMLKDQISGKNDSWSIRWYASIFLKKKLIFYPERSLVKNIGFDGTGVHCKGTSNVLDVELPDKPLGKGIPKVEENSIARFEICYFLKRLNRRLLWSYLTSFRWGTILQAIWKQLEDL